MTAKTIVLLVTTMLSLAFFPERDYSCMERRIYKVEFTDSLLVEAIEYSAKAFPEAFSGINTIEFLRRERVSFDNAMTNYWVALNNVTHGPFDEGVFSFYADLGGTRFYMSNQIPEGIFKVNKEFFQTTNEVHFEFHDSSYLFLYDYAPWNHLYVEYNGYYPPAKVNRSSYSVDN